MLKGLSGFKKYLMLVALVIVVILVAGCSTPSAPPVTTMDEVPRISPTEVRNKLDSGFNFVIIDTRSQVAYEESHITGSISIPLEEIAGRAGELKRYDEIITYCT